MYDQQFYETVVDYIAENGLKAALGFCVGAQQDLSDNIEESGYGLDDHQQADSDLATMVERLVAEFK